MLDAMDEPRIVHVAAEVPGLNVTVPKARRDNNGRDEENFRPMQTQDVGRLSKYTQLASRRVLRFRGLSS